MNTNEKQFSANRAVAAVEDGDDVDWIARRLQMGCRHTLANCLKAVRTHP
jgi:hypothetical protein